MKRLMHTAIAILLVLIACEVYFLWIGVDSVAAQGNFKFLGRPFYGPAAPRTSQFDHLYPLYNGEGSVQSVERRTMVRDTGEWLQEPSINVQATNCQTYFSCYTGHDAADFSIAYKPVVSGAAGIIRWAGWSDPDHSALLGLRIVLDHQNGYRTFYGHLSAVRYQTHAHINGRWQIGTSGNTGNSEAPHLHFGVESSTNGVVWKVTDPYGWNSTSYPDPWSLHPNGNSSKFLWLDEPQRTIAAPPENGDFTVDDGAPGTATTCLYGYHWTTVASVGHDNDLRYTFATGSNSFNCVASWGGVSPPPTSTLPSTGLYEVKVFVPYWNPANRTRAARYTIVFPGGLNTVVVDQSEPSSDEWISLGRYTFNQGNLQSQYVYLEDAAYVGTPPHHQLTDPYSRTLLVDAVRWTRSH